MSPFDFQICSGGLLLVLAIIARISRLHMLGVLNLDVSFSFEPQVLNDPITDGQSN